MSGYPNGKGETRICTAVGRTQIAQAIKTRGEEGMTTETQGKTDKDNINQHKEQTQSTELVSPKAGTATSSPTNKHPAQTNKVFPLSGQIKPPQKTHERLRVFRNPDENEKLAHLKRGGRGH